MKKRVAGALFAAGWAQEKEAARQPGCREIE